MEDLGDLFNSDDICKDGDAFNILERNVSDDYIISEKQEYCLNMWLEFKNITNFESLGVPVWVEYFGYNLSDEEYKDFMDHKGKKFLKCLNGSKDLLKKIEISIKGIKMNLIYGFLNMMYNHFHWE